MKIVSVGSRLLFGAMFLCLSLVVKAQDGYASSPFSQVGFGLIDSSYQSPISGLGGVSTALLDPHYSNLVNTQNPASYSGIFLTSFDISAGLLYSKFETDRDKASTSNFSVRYASLAFPVTKSSAFVVSLRPFTDKGYDYYKEADIDSSIRERFYGSGGISEVFAGYGTKLGKYFSLGMNIGFLFGEVSDETVSENSNDATFLPAHVSIKNNVNGALLEVGMIFSKKMGKNKKLTVGYTLSSRNNVQVKQEVFSGKILSQSNGITQDTLRFSTTQFDKKFPIQHRMGIAFEKTNYWLLGMDLRYYDWADFSYPNIIGTLGKAYGVSVGGQWIPDYKSISDYFKRIQYNFGLRYDKVGYAYNGSDVTELGFSTGASFPLAQSLGTFPRLNFSLEYVLRGNVADHGLKEQNIRILLGITLNNKWFVKQQYN